MDNHEACLILCKARKEDVNLAIELNTGSTVYGKVCKITPLDEWVVEGCKASDLPVCVVEIHRECLSGEGWVDRCREHGITNYVSVDQIADIEFHAY